MAQIQRIVLFRWKAGTSEQTIAEIFKALDGLQQSIPGMRQYSSGACGADNGMADGYTHAFVVTFADEAARDGFGPHEAHQAAVAKLGPHVEKVLAFDYPRA